MRDIKFRAWDNDFLKMHWYLEKAHNLPTPQPLHWYLEIKDRFDIMQYTGLKDKNGKEIYEGDIVKIDDNPDQFKGTEFHDREDVSHHQIIWDNDRAMFTDFRLEDGDSLAGFLDGDISFVCDGEIIGNIYENQELL